ncbi:MAG: hypothetical protein Q8N13_08600 [Acidovorax sp.]|nr:hypothetical protein [Acidovorax sp.]
MSATATPSSPESAAVSPPAPTGHSGSGVPFVLYALRGRVYASNVKQKLVDLGHLAQQDDGMWTYLLDGDKSTGAGFEAPDAALQHIAGTTTFLFLDGQFTALEDLGGVDRPDVQAAPQCEVTLDPLGRGERMIAPRG